MVKEALELHKQLTKEEQGCLVFNVDEDDKDPCIYHVYEEFSSQEAFDAHQLRVKQSHWGQVTKNVQRFYSVTQSDM